MDKNQQKQLTVFGYGLPVILTFLAVVHGRKHSWDMVSTVMIAAAVAVLVLGLFFRLWLAVIFRYWMRMAHAIGQVVTVLILGFVFCLIFVPAGIVLKMLGKDLLNRQQDPKVLSYWIKREECNNDQLEYTRQY